jgi:hypothetical protein
VILLSGHFVKYDPTTYKLGGCSGRTAYLVSGHYFQTLLSNYKTGLSNLLQQYTAKYRGDVYWQILHQLHKWFIIMPQMCKQTPSYSDIQKIYTNYTSFLVGNTMRMGVFFNKYIQYQKKQETEVEKNTSVQKKTNSNVPMFRIGKITKFIKPFKNI